MKSYRIINKSKILDIIFIMICGAYLYYAYRAALPFLDAIYAIDSDVYEDLLVVKKLQPQSWSQFAEYYFFSLPINYHGLITLSFPAIISWIPSFFWGDAAIVFTMRMSGCILLILSYWIYARLYFKRMTTSIAFLVMSIFFPATMMFTIIPRCESYLYFFTAIFLFIQREKTWKSSKGYIFLGLAIISRISILPYVPLFLLLSFFAFDKGNRIKNALTNLGYLLLGIFIAQPQLLNRRILKEWILLKIAQMYDDTGMSDAVDYSYWIEIGIESFFKYSFAFYFFVVILIALTVYLLRFVGFRALIAEVPVYGSRQYLEKMFLGLISLACVFAIMFTIKIFDSAWYLQHHIIFFILSIFSLMESIPPAQKYWRLFNVLILLFAAYIIFFSLFTINDWTVSYSLDITSQWKRDKTPAAVQARADYGEIIDKIESFAKHAPRKVTIRVLDDHYRIKSSDRYEVLRWGLPAPFYFDDSGDLPDAIVVNRELYGFPFRKIDPAVATYKIESESQMNYVKYVVPAFEGNCRTGQCYQAKIINSRYLFFYKEGFNF